MCVEKRKRSNKYTYLTIISPPSQTALPKNYQRVYCKALPFVFLHHPVQILPVPVKESASAMRHSGTENVAALVLPASATRRRLGFLQNGSVQLKKITRSRFTMHALTTCHWALIGNSNRCKEGTALNIRCIPIHLAISGLDSVNVYGSAPELKQSSRTWQQKEAKFSGLWAVRHCLTAQLFSTVMSIYLGFF